jgi:integrase
MATLKCKLRNKLDNSNIYVYYSISKDIRLWRKTGFIINFKDWNPEKEQSKLKDEDSKKMNIRLSELKTHLEKNHNIAISEGIGFTGDWLQMQIDVFNNKTPVVELDILTNYIQKYIDDAPFKQNQKKELGLSAGRVANIRLFKKTIIRYETETLKDKSIIIKDINLQFVEKYKSWLFSKNYSINYVGKNIANIKTICNDAFKNDIQVSNQLKNIKGVSERKEPEQIIYLSEEEQQQIQTAPLLRDALENARKWLLLGCLIGQRAGDLLSITERNIKNLNGMMLIEIKQQKTGKQVAVPLLPDALAIIKNGLPYKISLPRFNEYIKDICKIAGLTQMIKGKKPTSVKTGNKITSKKTGKKIDEKVKLNVAGTYHKYELVTSHICRRSFATNFYGRIPTPVLMNITAHGTERMFLSYIGKTTYDNAYQMLEYFSKLAPREKTPQMEVIHNTGTK